MKKEIIPHKALFVGVGIFALAMTTVATTAIVTLLDAEVHDTLVHGRRAVMMRHTAHAHEQDYRHEHRYQRYFTKNASHHLRPI